MTDGMTDPDLRRLREFGEALKLLHQTLEPVRYFGLFLRGNRNPDEPSQFPHPFFFRQGHDVLLTRWAYWQVSADLNRTVLWHRTRALRQRQTRPTGFHIQLLSDQQITIKCRM